MNAIATLAVLAALAAPVRAKELIVEFRPDTTGEQAAAFLGVQQRNGIVPGVLTLQEDAVFIVRLTREQPVAEALKVLRADPAVSQVREIASRMPRTVGGVSVPHPVLATFSKGTELTHVNALIDRLGGAGHLETGSDVVALKGIALRCRLAGDLIVEPAPPKAPIVSLEAEVGAIRVAFAPQTSLRDINRWIWRDSQLVYYEAFAFSGEGRRMRAVVKLKPGQNAEKAAAEFLKDPRVIGVESARPSRPDGEAGAQARARTDGALAAVTRARTAAAFDRSR